MESNTYEIMVIDELYMILGKLTLHYSKVQFLAANMAKQMGMVDNPYVFFAKSDEKGKITSMRNAAHGLADPKIKKAMLEWLNSFDLLRKERNLVMHSIILKNSQQPDDYMMYSYQIQDGKLDHTHIHYTSDLFRELEKRLTDVHNTGYEIFKKMIPLGNTLNSPKL